MGNQKAASSSLAVESVCSFWTGVTASIFDRLEARSSLRGNVANVIHCVVEGVNYYDEPHGVLSLLAVG